MILADTNIWLALSLTGHDFHSAVVQWIDREIPTIQLGFCRATQQSFLRLMTTAAVVSRYGIAALDNASAWSVYLGLRSNSYVVWMDEPVGTESKWKELAARPQASPKLWMDAYLAAFAVAGGYEILTTDTGFRQFTGVSSNILSPK